MLNTRKLLAIFYQALWDALLVCQLVHFQAAVHLNEACTAMILKQRQWTKFVCSFERRFSNFISTAKTVVIFLAVKTTQTKHLKNIVFSRVLYISNTNVATIWANGKSNCGNVNNLRLTHILLIELTHMYCLLG